jgi:hypothetical protein
MVFILNGGYIIILQVQKDIFPLLSVNQANTLNLEIHYPSSLVSTELLLEELEDRLFELFANETEIEKQVDEKLSLLRRLAKNPNDVAKWKDCLGLIERDLDTQEKPSSKSDDQKSEKETQNQNRNKVISKVTQSKYPASVTETPRTEARESRKKELTSEEKSIIESVSDLQEAIQDANYNGYEEDIKSLESIKSMSLTSPSTSDAEALEILRNWGIDFYREKQNAPGKLREDIWAKYVDIMRDSLGVLVIYETGSFFNPKDHLVLGGSKPAPNARVKKIIKPGFKVSHAKENPRFGKKGQVFEQAHVVTENGNDAGVR